MTAQELMTPRFEVIANYPKMMYSLNQILYCTSEYQSSFFSEFPHLFKKLNWWEYRTKEEMPNKVTFQDRSVYNISAWNLDFPVTGSTTDGGFVQLEIWKPEFGYFPID